MHPDVVIIGGGIAGCACAYFLARAGLRVHLLERGPLGSGASKAGMSHVVTWEEPELHLTLARASQRLYERLQDDLPVKIEYRQTGSIAVVEKPEGLPGMAQMLARLQAWGLDCQMLSTDDLRRMEPNLSPDLAGGAYFPGDGQVNPLYTTQALAHAAREAGAVVETQCPVTGFVFQPGGALAAVETARGQIPTGAAVIAAGPWSAELAALAGFPLPIQPRKGHLLVTAPVSEDLLACKVVLSSGYMDSVNAGGSGVAVAANVQQVGNGNLLLGSSRQFARFDVRVEPAVIAQIAARCTRFFPFLARVPVLRMWAGLRPYTPDLLPVIGPVTRAPGLYVASGHEGIGITEAPVTGLLISQMITGQPLALPADRLSPDRFASDVVIEQGIVRKETNG